MIVFCKYAAWGRLLSQDLSIAWAVDLNVEYWRSGVYEVVISKHVSRRSTPWPYYFFMAL